MTDLNPEGLENAAEALATRDRRIWEVASKRDQGIYREFARAAVSAYLGHTEVATVEGLSGLPVGAVIQDRKGCIWEADNTMDNADLDRWCPIGRWRPFDPDHLPATVLHRGGGQ